MRLCFYLCRKLLVLFRTFALKKSNLAYLSLYLRFEGTLHSFFLSFFLFVVSCLLSLPFSSLLLRVTIVLLRIQGLGFKDPTLWPFYCERKKIRIFGARIRIFEYLQILCCSTK
jgi:hypothetical protein